MTPLKLIGLVLLATLGLGLVVVGWLPLLLLFGAFTGTLDNTAFVTTVPTVIALIGVPIARKKMRIGDKFVLLWVYLILFTGLLPGIIILMGWDVFLTALYKLRVSPVQQPPNHPAR